MRHTIKPDRGEPENRMGCKFADGNTGNVESTGDRGALQEGVAPPRRQPVQQPYNQQRRDTLRPTFMQTEIAACSSRQTTALHASKTQNNESCAQNPSAITKTSKNRGRDGVADKHNFPTTTRRQKETIRTGRYSSYTYAKGLKRQRPYATESP